VSPELRVAGRQQQIADDGSQLVMPINRYVNAAHGVLSDAEQRLSPAKKDEMVHLINPRCLPAAP
jgi:hypothetical protein